MPSVSIKQGWPLLLLLIAMVMGMGLLVGLIAAPGDYVAGLRTPDLVLPTAVSGALWVVLSVSFAVAGWRSWSIDSNSLEMRLWLAALILSWWFSPAFFMLRSPLLALVVIVLLLAVMALYTVRTWKTDRPSAWLFVPSLVYIGYIAAMTGAIVAMN
jgi:tryptophan-rich sensory protein